jgi:hypothetical protein
VCALYHINIHNLLKQKKGNYGKEEGATETYPHRAATSIHCPLAIEPAFKEVSESLWWSYRRFTEEEKTKMNDFFTQFLPQIPMTANINDNMNLIFKEIGLLSHPFFKYPLKYNTVKILPPEPSGPILPEIDAPAGAPPAPGSAAQPPAGAKGTATDLKAQPGPTAHPQTLNTLAPPAQPDPKAVAAGTLTNLDAAQGRTVIEPIKPEDQTFIIFNNIKLDYATIKFFTIALAATKITCLKYGGMIESWTWVGLSIIRLKRMKRENC